MQKTIFSGTIAKLKSACTNLISGSVRSVRGRDVRITGVRTDVHDANINIM